MGAIRSWRVCYSRNPVSVGSNQLPFAFVPGREEFCGRGCPNDTWMWDTCESDTRDVPRGCVDTCAWVVSRMKFYSRKFGPLRSQIAFAALDLNSRAASQECQETNIEKRWSNRITRRLPSLECPAYSKVRFRLQFGNALDTHGESPRHLRERRN